VKKWLKQILEILMAERGKEERSEQVIIKGKEMTFQLSNKIILNFRQQS